MSTTKVTNTFIFPSKDNLYVTFTKALGGIKPASVKLYPLFKGGIHWSMHIFHQQFNMIKQQIWSTERNSSTLAKCAGQTMFHAYLERVKVLVLTKQFSKCKLSHKGAADRVKYFPSLKPMISFTSLHPFWKKPSVTILQCRKLLEKPVCVEGNCF